jgi:hypothetical protein
MTASVATMQLSDTIPLLDSLHQHLFARYRDLLVPPVSVDRLFTPRQRDVAFVRQEYLADPTIATRVDGIYRQFRSALRERP